MQLMYSFKFFFFNFLLTVSSFMQLKGILFAEVLSSIII
jgi:hypothetical protein